MNIELGQKAALVNEESFFGCRFTGRLALITEVVALSDKTVFLNGFSGNICVDRETLKRRDASQNLDLDWQKWLTVTGCHQMNYTRTNHHLKCWPVFFKEVWAGSKPFEVRKNDRNFQAGDELTLDEWCPEVEGSLGRTIHAVVLYVLEHTEHLKEGYCVMGIRVTHKYEKKNLCLTK